MKTKYLLSRKWKIKLNRLFYAIDSMPEALNFLIYYMSTLNKKIIISDKEFS